MSFYGAIRSYAQKAARTREETLGHGNKNLGLKLFKENLAGDVTVLMSSEASFWGKGRISGHLVLKNYRDLTEK